MLVVSGSPMVALVFGCLAAWLPLGALGRRAAKRRGSLVASWPDAVDDLASAVRAGMSLPDAVAALADRGPAPLRPSFARFAADHRVTGSFGTCLDRLKDDLADPVGDRVVEALRLARDVGGTELGRLLRTLSAVLREDARTRSELEARQGWAVNAARLAVAAPWATLAFLSLRPGALAAYDSAGGAIVLAVAGVDERARVRRDEAHRPAARRRAGADVTAVGRPRRRPARLGRPRRPWPAWVGAVRSRRPTASRPTSSGRPSRHRAATTSAPGSTRRRSSGSSGRRCADSPYASTVLLGGGDAMRRAARRGRPTAGHGCRVPARAAHLGGGWAPRQRRADGPARAWRADRSARRQPSSSLSSAGSRERCSRDRALTRDIERRREAIRVGLPPVADLLALAVASGESPAAALDRVARVGRGPLAEECRRACHDTASGVSFVDALDAMATRIDVPAVRRFVDGVAIAVQRGTPLAEVLRAQAGDARADLHRSLLEIAGRKELLMLVPVVFLVLPTVVLVALFPAVSSLTSLAP